MLVIDFETRSRCELKKNGAYKYAADPSTDIICCAFYDIETEHEYVWYPSRGRLPDIILYNIEHADFIVAHNAEFDRLIWESIAVEDYDFPALPPEKWYCSSAQCRVNAIPASLKDAGWALGLTRQKFDAGAGLIKKLSIPQKDGTFNTDENLLIEMYKYCMQDALVTGDIIRATRSMSQDEHQDWLTNFAVNDRGVKIDRELAEYALNYAADEQKEIGEKMAALTAGKIIKHTQTARIREWLLRNDPQLDALMSVYKDGVKKYSLDKGVRNNIITELDNGTLHISDETEEVIRLLDDGNKSSVAKFGKMLDLADEDDDRVRGAFIFAGASQTIRYTSRGLQLHNMRRDCWDVEEAERLKDLMRDDYVLYSGEPGHEDIPVMEALSKMLRPAIIPDEGKTLVVGDWSAIEARVLPWLSDSRGGDSVLEVFRSGKDIYMETAKMMGLESRQIGKVATLALGYQGGINAFQAMAKNYGLAITDSEAQVIVDQWRGVNSWAPSFWLRLDNAAKKAIGAPGTWVDAGRVSYIFMPDFIEGTLVCRLPNDGLIQYPKALVEEVATPWGGTANQVTAMKASFKPKADAKEWPRVSLYGGIFCENIAQATAAALLRDCIRHLPHVIATVHDEIVMEVPDNQVENWMGVLKYGMETAPAWAEGLPLTAEPVTMRRYGK